MATNDCYRLTVSMSHLGSTYLNVIGMRQKTSSVALADFTSIANAVKEMMRPSQNNDLTWRSWRAVQVRGGSVVPNRDKCTREGGVVFEAAYTGTVIGGGTGSESLPPQSAMVITMNTGKVGRRFRGRIYVPGFNELSQSSGTFVSSVMTTMTTNTTTFNNLYSTFGTDPTWEVGVWSERIATGCTPDPVTHKLVNHDAPDLANAFSGMASLIPRPTVFTQRRRTLGVGR